MSKDICRHLGDGYYDYDGEVLDKEYEYLVFGDFALDMSKVSVCFDELAEDDILDFLEEEFPDMVFDYEEIYMINFSHGEVIVTLCVNTIIDDDKESTALDSVRQRYSTMTDKLNIDWYKAEFYE